MKKVLFGLLIVVLVFSGLSCFANEVADYGKSLNLPPEVVETIAPLGKDGMDENEKALVDAIYFLPPEVQVSETVLNLLKEIVQDTVATNEELDRFKDLDQDGLSNQEELKQGTDLLNPDTDDDGLKDGEEVLTYGTNPLELDSDNDGLNDGDEVLVHGTTPLKEDSDSDGLTDEEEILIYKSDPLDSDSDGDSLNDGQEVHIHGTNPLKKDTDGDGFEDREELFLLRSDARDKDSPFVLIAESEDSDGDGVKDCDDLEPLEPNTYKETISWLSEEMKKDALSYIVEGDKVRTFRTLSPKVHSNVPHGTLVPAAYPNAIWRGTFDELRHPRDLLMDYYSYPQRVYLSPDCDDIACVYDIIADYIIEQTGWDEEGGG